MFYKVTILLSVSIVSLIESVTLISSIRAFIRYKTNPSGTRSAAELKLMPTSSP